MDDPLVKTCPHCLSDIPRKAPKCRYCGEWTTPGAPTRRPDQLVDDTIIKILLSLAAIGAVVAYVAHVRAGF